ncbi:hypothetical protein BKA69DRAFT_1126462 [Paraphysoderma sedebokerense]|nr:hypothetical protein BKA69DRAFT_1126462 [Paraphysoderma sedebokerense]
MAVFYIADLILSLGTVSVVSTSLILILSVYLFYATTRSPSKSPHRLFHSHTFHARFYPVTHKFIYPVLYFGLDLNELEKNGKKSVLGCLQQHPLAWCWSWLFGLEERGLWSIWADDYLSELSDGSDGKVNRRSLPVKTKPNGGKNQDGGKWTSLRQGALNHLEAKGIHSASIGRILLVTTPRFLGYSFNPLSVYYCYRQAKDDSTDTEDLVAVILEVNNTFSERHVYICCPENALERTEVREGYDQGYQVQRSFHVSPFNDRLGKYMVYLSNPSNGLLKIRLNMYRYPSSDSNKASSESQAQKHLTATLDGSGVELTPRMLMYTSLKYPVTVFLTVPRIMLEAGKLAYKKRLLVYPRPNPIVNADKTSGTVVMKDPTFFESYSTSLFLDYLKSRIIHQPDLSISLYFPLPKSPVTISSSEVEATKLHLTFHNHEFFARLLSSTNVISGLIVGYVAADIDISITTSKLDLDASEKNNQVMALKKLVNFLIPVPSKSSNESFGMVFEQALYYIRRLNAGIPSSQHPRPSSCSHLINTPKSLDSRLLPTLSDDSFNIFAILKHLIYISAHCILSYLEQTWFTKITNFVWNPFQVNKRINIYLNELEDSTFSSSNDITKGDAAKKMTLKDLLDDDLVKDETVQRYRKTMEQLERERLDVCWKAILEYISELETKKSAGKDSQQELWMHLRSWVGL